MGFGVLFTAWLFLVSDECRASLGGGWIKFGEVGWSGLCSSGI